MKTKKLLFLLFFLSFVGITLAQVAQPTRTIRLKNGDIAMVPNATKWLDSFLSAHPKEPAYVVIQCSRFLSAQDRVLLASAGLSLGDYIPENSYLALLAPSLNVNDLAKTPLVSILGISGQWKINQAVLEQLKKDGLVDVLVSFNQFVTPAQISALLKFIGAQVIATDKQAFGLCNIRLEAAKVSGLAQWYGVQSIDISKEMEPLDHQSKPVVRGFIATADISAGGYGLGGDSVVVGVGDNASAIYHADVNDRITNFAPVPMAAHGSHVTGIVGATGTVDPLGEGMAPRVGLLNFFYDQVIAHTPAMARGYGMTITNNSYSVLLGSCSYAGTYDGYSRYLDSLALAQPNVLHVFASANDGYLTCSPFPLGFATVSGGYQPAKNNIVVGSITDYLLDAYDESRGPVKDGRLKPELVAVGLGAYSTIGVDDYEWAAGTSMASPQVAGGLALLSQRFRQKNGTIPSAQTLKAIALAGAGDLGNFGPDFRFGFGVLNVAQSIKIIDNNQLFSSTLGNGESYTQTITVPANTALLKVLITWHDKPASTLAANQLVNDLDISVTAPSGSRHLPLVPDNASSNVQLPATEKVDHINNTEEVVLKNPVAGTYTIRVSGYSVPSGPQSFSLAYDILPVGITLTYPRGGEMVQATDTTNRFDTVRIFWDGIDDGNTQKVEFSTNNGASWVTLSDSVGSNEKYFPFRPDRINSGDCLIRVSKNGTSFSATSGRFVINQQPVLKLHANQCPGYIRTHWAPTPSATSYELFMKLGKYLELVGTTTDTNFTFKGASIRDKSYVVVRPVLSGLPGYRSKSLIVTANSGNCIDPISAGDLMLERVVKPVSGRLKTTTALSNSEPVVLKLRNLSSSPATNYNISIRVNGGAWRTSAARVTIAANDTALVAVTGFDFSDTVAYAIDAAVTNTTRTDPYTLNDSVRHVFRHAGNAPLALPYTDDFEQPELFNIMHDSACFGRAYRWDFANSSQYGRLRNFVSESVTLSGTRSMSLDVDRVLPTGSQNYLTGTFNLSGYDTATSEVRLDFDYVLHGTPKSPTGNLVNARACDTCDWLPLLAYNVNGYAGTLERAKSLSLTDVARYTKRNFSTSFQISLGQSDTSLIAARAFGNGISIDNVKAYTVANDAGLVSIQSPLAYNCGLNPSQPLIIEVKNGVNYTLYNVQVYYRVDTGAVFSGLIDSIPAKSSVNYTFTQNIDLPTGTSRAINVWLAAPGDTYPDNDTIASYMVRNNNIVTAFPYLQNFELGKGDYYTSGNNSSWQFGAPAGRSIGKAASGKFAWKTGIAGRYNNMEQSYLYTPCFDVSGLANPMLSFSAAIDVEDCGNVLCDKAFVEYSYNGTFWRRLGNAGEGTNWYDPTFQAWTRNAGSRWRVASIPIPKAGVGNTIAFRFGLQTDPAVTLDGFALDDIHIFDRDSGIATPSTPITINQDNSGNSWQKFNTPDNKAVAALLPNNQLLPNTAVTVFKYDTVVNPGATQYLAPRNYTLKTSVAPNDSVSVRLFLPEAELIYLLARQNCPSCVPVEDAYRLGITQYYNMFNHSLENNSLIDDTGGVFRFISPSNINWVPYDNGYYAQFKCAYPGEFWFNNGGPGANVAANSDPITFTAYLNGPDILVKWRSDIDTLVDSYYVERSVDSLSFFDVLDTNAVRRQSASYLYKELAGLSSSIRLYYRLRYTVRGRVGRFYTPIRAVDLTEQTENGIALRADIVAENTAKVQWRSVVDQLVTTYTLERAINNRGFVPIATRQANRYYLQQYDYLDGLAGSKNGDVIKYRVKATLDGGEIVTSGEATLIWAKLNSLLTVYPNPSRDGRVNISWLAAPSSTIKIALFDMAGRKWLEGTDKATQWTNTTTITTPWKPRGVYVLQVEINGEKHSEKVVFE